MRKQLIFSLNIFLSILVFCITIYKHIHNNNQLTAIQLAIPQLEKEVKNLQIENERLQYEIDRFESPIHLMELLRNPEFGHLRFPKEEEVMIIKKEKARV